MMFIANLLAKQFRRPSGLLGLYAQRFMLKNNSPRIEWTIKVCDIQDTDIVLEIGFGPGIGISLAAAKTKLGKMYGLDFSKAMMKKATRFNKVLIENSRVELRLGDLNPSPFPGNFFDKIFAVNVVYFWPHPEKELNEIARMLKPGGKVVLCLSDRVSMDSVPFTNTGVFHKYTAEEFLPVINACAFSKVTYESSVQMRDGKEMLAHCFIATK
jgi:ubiquinone/menaquinone biosynthesis C-methylase UbiE